MNKDFRQVIADLNENLGQCPFDRLMTQKSAQDRSNIFRGGIVSDILPDIVHACSGISHTWGQIADILRLTEVSSSEWAIEFTKIFMLVIKHNTIGYFRIMTFCYLAAFNWWLLLCPWTLSHDWQMGSIPLVTSGWDPRNLLTCAALFTLLAMSYRCLADLEVRLNIEHKTKHQEITFEECGMPAMTSHKVFKHSFTFWNSPFLISYHFSYRNTLQLSWDWCCWWYHTSRRPTC